MEFVHSECLIFEDYIAFCFMKINPEIVEKYLKFTSLPEPPVIEVSVRHNFSQIVT